MKIKDLIKKLIHFGDDKPGGPIKKEPVPGPKTPTAKK